MKKKDSLVDRIYQEVMRDLQRIDGEDYEEYMEAVRYEVNARLTDMRKQDLFTTNVRYDQVFDIFFYLNYNKGSDSFLTPSHTVVRVFIFYVVFPKTPPCLFQIFSAGHIFLLTLFGKYGMELLLMVNNTHHLTRVKRSGIMENVAIRY